MPRKRSEFITGRASNKKAWTIAKEGHRCFVVGAFTTSDGRTMYADAIYIGNREGYDGVKKVRPHTRCLYRVIVTPKVSEI